MMVHYQTTTYLILCAIIFCETGLVATPFLPGDSLLFAAGMLTAQNNILNIWLLILLLFCAAILGDNTNYFIGRFAGERIFTMRGLRKIIKREYLDRTHKFYDKYGAQTIIVARFVPIVRTFAPFAAGVGKMNYAKYITYCVIGGAAWVTALSLAGFYLGRIQWIKDHFELVVFGIIFVSILPIIISFIKAKMDKKAGKKK
jgi:membrane-associated protein